MFGESFHSNRMTAQSTQFIMCALRNLDEGRQPHKGRESWASARGDVITAKSAIHCHHSNKCSLSPCTMYCMVTWGFQGRCSMPAKVTTERFHLFKFCFGPDQVLQTYSLRVIISRRGCCRSQEEGERRLIPALAPLKPGYFVTHALYPQGSLLSGGVAQRRVVSGAGEWV